VSGLPGNCLSRSGLEQPPRSDVARYRVDRGLLDKTTRYVGVDGRPFAGRNADVGDAATAFGPEDQVTGLWRAVDRAAVTVLGRWRVGQRDTELGIDQHGVAGAVLPDVDLARPRRREYVGRAHVGH
jgi:hypothetical protein